MLTLIAAAALTATPIDPAIKAEATAWGGLAYTAGRCYYWLTPTEVRQFEGALDRAPASFKPTFAAIYAKGKRDALSDSISRATCNKVLTEYVADIEKLQRNGGN